MLWPKITTDTVQGVQSAIRSTVLERKIDLLDRFQDKLNKVTSFDQFDFEKLFDEACKVPETFPDKDIVTAGGRDLTPLLTILNEPRIFQLNCEYKFRKFDDDRGGTLEAEECYNCLKEMAMDLCPEALPSHESFDRWFSMLDVRGEAKLNVKEFSKLVNYFLKNVIDRSQVASGRLRDDQVEILENTLRDPERFRSFIDVQFAEADVNCDGEISLAELKDQMGRLCSKYSREIVPDDLAFDRWMDFFGLEQHVLLSRSQFSMFIKEFLTTVLERSFIARGRVPKPNADQLKALLADSKTFTQVCYLIFDKYDDDGSKIVEFGEACKCMTDLTLEHCPDSTPSIKEFLLWWRMLGKGKSDGLTKPEFTSFVRKFLRNVLERALIAGGRVSPASSRIINNILRDEDKFTFICRHAYGLQVAALIQENRAVYIPEGPPPNADELTLAKFKLKTQQSSALPPLRLALHTHNNRFSNGRGILKTPPHSSMMDTMNSLRGRRSVPIAGASPPARLQNLITASDSQTENTFHAPRNNKGVLKLPPLSRVPSNSSAISSVLASGSNSNQIIGSSLPPPIFEHAPRSVPSRLPVLSQSPPVHSASNLSSNNTHNHTGNSISQLHLIADATDNFNMHQNFNHNRRLSSIPLNPPFAASNPSLPHVTSIFLSYHDNLDPNPVDIEPHVQKILLPRLEAYFALQEVAKIVCPEALPDEEAFATYWLLANKTTRMEPHGNKEGEGICYESFEGMARSFLTTTVDRAVIYAGRLPLQMLAFVKNLLADKARFERATRRDFKRFDVDGSGSMDRDEAWSCFVQMAAQYCPDVPPVRAEFELTFDSVDVDRSGELDLREFQELSRIFLSNTVSRAEAAACRIPGDAWTYVERHLQNNDGLLLPLLKRAFKRVIKQKGNDVAMNSKMGMKRNSNIFGSSTSASSSSLANQNDDEDNDDSDEDFLNEELTKTTTFLALQDVVSLVCPDINISQEGFGVWWMLVDEDESGSLSFDEFIALCQRYLSSTLERSRLCDVRIPPVMLDNLKVWVADRTALAKLTERCLRAFQSKKRASRRQKNKPEANISLIQDTPDNIMPEATTFDPMVGNPLSARNSLFGRQSIVLPDRPPSEDADEVDDGDSEIGSLFDSDFEVDDKNKNSQVKATSDGDSQISEDDDEVYKSRISDVKDSEINSIQKLDSVKDDNSVIKDAAINFNANEYLTGKTNAAGGFYRQQKLNDEVSQVGLSVLFGRSSSVAVDVPNDTTSKVEKQKLSSSALIRFRGSVAASIALTTITERVRRGLKLTFIEAFQVLQEIANSACQGLPLREEDFSNWWEELLDASGSTPNKNGEACITVKQFNNLVDTFVSHVVAVCEVNTASLSAAAVSALSMVLSLKGRKTFRRIADAAFRDQLGFEADPSTPNAATNMASITANALLQQKARRTEVFLALETVLRSVCPDASLTLETFDRWWNLIGKSRIDRRVVKYFKATASWVALLPEEEAVILHVLDNEGNANTSGQVLEELGFEIVDDVDDFEYVNSQPITSGQATAGNGMNSNGNISNGINNSSTTNNVNNQNKHIMTTTNLLRTKSSNTGRSLSKNLLEKHLSSNSNRGTNTDNKSDAILPSEENFSIRIVLIEDDLLMDSSEFRHLARLFLQDVLDRSDLCRSRIPPSMLSRIRKCIQNEDTLKKISARLFKLYSTMAKRKNGHSFTTGSSHSSMRKDLFALSQSPNENDYSNRATPISPPGRNLATPVISSGGNSAQALFPDSNLQFNGNNLHVPVVMDSITYRPALPNTNSIYTGHTISFLNGVLALKSVASMFSHAVVPTEEVLAAWWVLYQTTSDGKLKSNLNAAAVVGGRHQQRSAQKENFNSWESKEKKSMNIFLGDASQWVVELSSDACLPLSLTQWSRLLFEYLSFVVERAEIASSRFPENNLELLQKRVEHRQLLRSLCDAVFFAISQEDDEEDEDEVENQENKDETANDTSNNNSKRKPTSTSPLNRSSLPPPPSAANDDRKPSPPSPSIRPALRRGISAVSPGGISDASSSPYSKKDVVSFNYDNVSSAVDRSKNAGSKNVDDLNLCFDNNDDYDNVGGGGSFDNEATKSTDFGIQENQKSPLKVINIMENSTLKGRLSPFNDNNHSATTAPKSRRFESPKFDSLDLSSSTLPLVPPIKLVSKDDVFSLEGDDNLSPILDNGSARKTLRFFNSQAESYNEFVNLSSPIKSNVNTPSNPTSLHENTIVKAVGAPISRLPSEHSMSPPSSTSVTEHGAEDEEEDEFAQLDWSDEECNSIATMDAKREPARIQPYPMLTNTDQIPPLLPSDFSYATMMSPRVVEEPLQSARSISGFSVQGRPTSQSIRTAIDFDAESPGRSERSRSDNSFGARSVAPGSVLCVVDIDRDSDVKLPRSKLLEASRRVTRRLSTDCDPSESMLQYWCIVLEIPPNQDVTRAQFVNLISSHLLNVCDRSSMALWRLSKASIATLAAYLAAYERAVADKEARQRDASRLLSRALSTMNASRKSQHTNGGIGSGETTAQSLAKLLKVDSANLNSRTLQALAVSKKSLEARIQQQNQQLQTASLIGGSNSIRTVSSHKDRANQRQAVALQQSRLLWKQFESIAKKVFETADVDKGGTLDALEILPCMREMFKEICPEARITEKLLRDYMIAAEGCPPGDEVSSLTQLEIEMTPRDFLKHVGKLVKHVMDCGLIARGRIPHRSWQAMFSILGKRKNLKELARQNFEKFDLDASGEIDKEEAFECLNDIALQLCPDALPTAIDFERWWTVFDEDKSNTLDQLEFFKFIKCYLEEAVDRAKIASFKMPQVAIDYVNSLASEENFHLVEQQARDAFNKMAKYCVSGGKLPKQRVLRILRRSSRRLLPFALLDESDIKSIWDSKDRDKDSLASQDELVEMLKSVFLLVADRAVIGGGRIPKRLGNALRNLLSSPERIDQRCNEMFEAYDLDRSGLLDDNETARCLQEIVQKLCPDMNHSSEDIEAFFQDSGVRETLAEIGVDKSAFKDLFVAFLEEILERADIAQGLISSCSTKAIKRMLSRPVAFTRYCEMIYSRYDADGSDSLNSDECFLCLQDLANRLCPESLPLGEDFDAWFKEIDDNESGDLDQAEFRLLVRKFLQHVVDQSEKTTEVGDRMLKQSQANQAASSASSKDKDKNKKNPPVGGGLHAAQALKKT